LGRRQIAAPDVEGADVEMAAIEVERVFGVELQRHRREAVAAEALSRAARHIAEQFGVLDDVELYAGVLED
jgi:hypothetical protein